MPAAHDLVWSRFVITQDIMQYWIGFGYMASSLVYDPAPTMNNIIKANKQIMS